MPISRRVLLDTSFVVALENRSDQHHQTAKSLDRQLLAEGAVLVLHWGILLEIGDGYARLNRRQKGIDLLDRFVSEKGYEIHSVDSRLLATALQLYRDRQDKEWGLTDCVSIVLMEQLGLNEALTADAHFRQAGFKPLLLDEP